MPQIEPHLRANCKLEQGDILLVTGDAWEASYTILAGLKKNLNMMLSVRESRIRNAKISSLYQRSNGHNPIGCIQRATSKLISNDAMDLSLLISDALAIDTNTAPSLIFAHADLLAFQNKDEASDPNAWIQFLYFSE